MPKRPTQTNSKTELSYHGMVIVPDLDNFVNRDSVLILPKVTFKELEEA